MHGSKKDCYSITSSASRTPIAVNSIPKRRRWGLDRGETARPGGHRRILGDGSSVPREAVLRIIPENPPAVSVGRRAASGRQWR